MNQTSVLGIQINVIKKSEAFTMAADFLQSSKPNYIFTPNPEMVVDASRDANFKQALNQGDLNLCDGFGLSLFARTPRITGTDFMLEVCALAAKEHKTVYLLGSGNREVLAKTQESLLQKFPNLNIVGSNPGYKIELLPEEKGTRLDFNPHERDEMLHEIIMCAPDILLVAFGHNKQEQWIVENVPNLPSVTIAMGVGGAFDFFGGKSKRAPKFLQAIGLEWLWRLVLEPKRIKRILKAVVVFPFLVLLKKDNGFKN